MSSDERASARLDRVGTGVRKPLVLIVEDDGDTCEVFQLFLSGHGFATRVAYNADQALDVLAERTPDVILLDYFIHGNLGASDLVAVVHARKLTSQFVLVSGTSDLRQRAESLEIKHTLRKPCDLDELLALVERLVSTAAIENEQR